MSLSAIERFFPIILCRFSTINSFSVIVIISCPNQYQRNKSKMNNMLITSTSTIEKAKIERLSKSDFSKSSTSKPVVKQITTTTSTNKIAESIMNRHFGTFDEYNVVGVFVPPVCIGENSCLLWALRIGSCSILECIYLIQPSMR